MKLTFSSKVWMIGRKSALGSWSTTYLSLPQIQCSSVTSGSDCLLLDKIFFCVGLGELSPPQHNINTHSTASKKALLHEMPCIFSKVKVNWHHGRDQPDTEGEVFLCFHHGSWNNLGKTRSHTFSSKSAEILLLYYLWEQTSRFSSTIPSIL